MSDLALLLQGFFTDKLMRQRQASPHTVAAYRDTFTLLLGFVAQRTGRQAAQLGLADLDAPTIGAFLQHLEADRHNTAATRNARLAAVRSLFRYAAPRAPDHAALIQRVLAIPTKRFDRAIVSFLTPAETDALLQAPDRTTWTGRRDHALLLVALHTGLRVSELVGLRLHDVQLGTGPHLRCRGKAERTAAPRSPPPPARCCGPGWPNAAASTATRCFPPAAAPHSAATPCSAWSPSTPPPQRCAARRCCKRG